MDQQPPPAGNLIRVGRLADVQAAGCLTAHAGGYTLALVACGGQLFAVDNRCPHMGFPLHRGSVQEGILTCPWHHTRFGLQPLPAAPADPDALARWFRQFVEVRDTEGAERCLVSAVRRTGTSTPSRW
jgi:phenylpropionate dioxygenase-like ring-hydroxylating dioxygenase large terminal subunit